MSHLTKIPVSVGPHQNVKLELKCPELKLLKHKYKKYYQVCQQKGTNAHKLKFDPKDSVTVNSIMGGYLCAGSLSNLEDSRSVASVTCPLDGSIYSKAAFTGKVCQTCDLCMLGEDALGYSIKLEGGAPPQEPVSVGGASGSAMIDTSAAGVSPLDTAATDLFI